MWMMLSASIQLQADHHCPASRCEWCCPPVFNYKQIIIARQADGNDVFCQNFPTSRWSLPDKQMALMLSASIYLQADHHCPASRWDWCCLQSVHASQSWQERCRSRRWRNCTWDEQSEKRKTWYVNGGHTDTLTVASRVQCINYSYLLHNIKNERRKTTI